MFCQQCGTKNEDDALFCSECGTRLVANHQAVKTKQFSPVTQETIQRTHGTKKKPVLLIVLAVQMVITAALVAGLVLVIHNQNSPKKIAENYWKAAMEQQWGKAYEYCDFPDGEFMTRQMYINAMSTGEQPVEYNAYEILESEESAAQSAFTWSTDSSAKQDNESEGSVLQKVFYISYVPKGSSGRQIQEITLTRTNKKRFLFWTQWKVTNADCVVRNVDVEVPEGAKVTFNQVELSKEWASEKDGLTCYTIPELFRGEYQVEISMEGMKTYRILFQTYEESIHISRMEPTDEIKEALAEQLVTDAQEIVQNAIDGKSFSSVEAYFDESAIEENDIKDAYEQLQKLAGKGDNSGLVSYEVSDLVVNYEKCDYSEQGMIIRLSATGNYKESKWRERFFHDPELKSEDGEVTIRVTYVNVDGKWRLTALPLDAYDF